MSEVSKILLKPLNLHNWKILARKIIEALYGTY